MNFKRTRLAPTPSGYLHLGNILSFSITAALARKHHARILLRIDDLDHERAQPEYLQDIFDTLRFLDIPWDEGPQDSSEFEKNYSQRLRTSFYNSGLQELSVMGTVFACTCSRSQVGSLSPDGSYPGTCQGKNIPLEYEQAAWRIRTSETMVSIAEYGKGTSAVSLPREMKDFIVRKKNGDAAYQVTSLLDDIFYEVDLVVRGEDLRPSTAAQLYLASLFRAERFRTSVFLHHRLLLDEKNEKLSKSAGALSVHHLRGLGKSPGEIYRIIGNMCGFRSPVNNWEELGKAALGKRFDL